MNATQPGGWWSRIGGVGQVTIVAALLGLAAAVVPVAVSVARSDRTGPGRVNDAVVGQPPAHTTPDRTTPAPTTPAQTPELATLTAGQARPTVSQRCSASRPGNYAYVLDAELYWYDDDGELQRTVASGRGGVTLSLGSR